MYFMHIVYGVVCFCLINIGIVDSQDEDPEDEPVTTTEPNAEEDTTPEDKHTFVALIDIVFTDASRKSCTGAVIHNNVVLTAAHCFTDRNCETLLPELTLSFVVIGTKKMFEAAYEQYLPIERVVSHPKFKGWTADLALVFTFAGMTSDKPGQVIPLAGAKTQTPVDSNVTVLSWGKCRDDDEDEIGKKKGRNPSTDSDEDVRKRSGQNKVRRPKLDVQFRPRMEEADDTRLLRDGSEIDEDDTITKSAEAQPPHKSRYEVTNDASKEYIHRIKSRNDAATTSKKSRYIFSSSEEKNGNKGPKYDEHITVRYYSEQEKRKSKSKLKRTTTIDPFDIGSEEVERDYYIQAGFKKSYASRSKRKSGLELFKNWRRQMGTQKNELTVEVFGFVNVQACKKIVERTMPAIFSIKNVNEILCYSSEDRYITNEDSGAPALHNGNLVAVTVGGVETDGDHVAIGMKMSCFCPWIAENLPDGDGSNMNCCQNCCDTKHYDEKKSPPDDEDKGSDDSNKPSGRNKSKQRIAIVRFDDGNAKEMFDKKLGEGYGVFPHTQIPPNYMQGYPSYDPRYKSQPEPPQEYYGPSNSSFRSWYYVK